MIVICLYLLHRDIQKIVQNRTFGTTLFSLNRFFQPIVSCIKVRSRSELKIIHSFSAQGISYTRHALHSLTNEFRNVLHSQVIYIHQFIKILLVISRISILYLTQKARQDFLSICKCVIPQCRTILQYSHTRSVCILKVTSSHCFMRDTTVRITIFSLCESAGHSTRKEQDSHKRLNFHCI